MPVVALHAAPPHPGPAHGALTARSSSPATGVAPVVERTLLAQLAPPSAIINERGEILYLHGRTGPYLEPAPGEPSHNLFNMAREGLRLESWSASHATTPWRAPRSMPQGCWSCSTTRGA